MSGSHGRRQIAACRLPGWHEAEEHGAHDSEADGREHQRCIDAEHRRADPHEAASPTAQEGAQVGYGSGGDADRGRRDERARRSARERQHQALGEELADDAQATGAERETNRDLALARKAAREREAGEVHARDEQHETHGPEQDERGAPQQGIDALIVEGHGGHAARPNGSFHGKCGVDLRSEHADGCVCLLDRHAGPAASEQGVAVRERFVEVEGHGRFQRPPHVGPPGQPTKSSRRHADDGQGGAIESDDLAQHIRVAAKAPLPQAVTDDCDRRRADAVVISRKQTPDAGVDAEQGKVRRLDNLAVHSLGVASLVRLHSASVNRLVAVKTCCPARTTSYLGYDQIDRL